MSPPLVIPYTDGPVRRDRGPAVISVTDFALHAWHHYPAVVGTGLRLRQGWYALPGAIGLWLWTLPFTTRTGSISVWTDERALRDFVGLPLHREVMRRNRGRGALRSTSWTVEEFDAPEQRERACRWIVRGE